MRDPNVCPTCIKHPIEEYTDVDKIEWLQCDICDQWFHVKCLGLTKSDIMNLASFHCKTCSKLYGPSETRRKLKRTKTQIDYVALNEGDVFAVDKTMHPHVSRFLNFEPTIDADCKNSYEYIDILEDIGLQHCLQTGLKKPVLIPNADLKRVGMELPVAKEDITIDYITNEMGADTSLEVMDVLTQQSVSPGWDLGQWREYFLAEESTRDRIRNVISLEISDCKTLGKNFKRPRVVREWDLVDKVWVKEPKRPKVTKYCLMSVKESFTDFHLDFSGTAVYYTVCSGSKTFLMFPPTEHNLSLYTSWCLHQDQNYTWFADFCKNKGGKINSPSGGFKVNLKAGDLFMIPSGWIHSVYTPEDTIVIGGNFLTLMNIPMHLRINDVEKETHVPQRFRFPLFNKVMWLTSWYYYNHQDEFVTDLVPGNMVKEEPGSSDGSSLVKSENELPHKILKVLISHLKSHYELSTTNKKAYESIPFHLVGKDIETYFTKLTEWLSALDY